jgi:hypothetical protein
MQLPASQAMNFMPLRGGMRSQTVADPILQAMEADLLRSMEESRQQTLARAPESATIYRSPGQSLPVGSLPSEQMTNEHMRFVGNKRVPPVYPGQAEAQRASMLRAATQVDGPMFEPTMVADGPKTMVSPAMPSPGPTPNQRALRANTVVEPLGQMPTRIEPPMDTQILGTTARQPAGPGTVNMRSPQMSSTGTRATLPRVPAAPSGLGRMVGPGLGALGLGLTGYNAYNAYQEDGVPGVLGSAFDSTLGMFPGMGALQVGRNTAKMYNDVRDEFFPSGPQVEPLGDVEPDMNSFGEAVEPIEPYQMEDLGAPTGADFFDMQRDFMQRNTPAGDVRNMGTIGVADDSPIPFAPRDYQRPAPSGMRQAPSGGRGGSLALTDADWRNTPMSRPTPASEAAIGDMAPENARNEADYQEMMRMIRKALAESDMGGGESSYTRGITAEDLLADGERIGRGMR